MSETSSEAMENAAAPVKLMDRNAYYRSPRSANPWPSPMSHNTGTIGNTGGSSEPVKKYGGGFGVAKVDGQSTTARAGGATETISNFDDFSGFTFRKDTSARSGFGGSFGGTALPRIMSVDLNMAKDRSVPPSPPDVTLLANVPRRGGFGVAGSPRSDGISPTKRPRSGRRTGRRGRSGPGHCFHCQEHGHISRLCPKKAAETDEFDESEAVQLLDNDSTKKNASPAGRDGLYQNAKLENQKARESYYGGYNYGNNKSSVPMKSAVVGTGRSVGESSVPPSEVDKFSEQLDNALNLHTKTITLQPRGSSASSVATKAPSARITPNKAPVAPVTSSDVGSRDETKETTIDTLTIETRRTVKREGDIHFEETTTICFPRVLPSNVRIINAQIMPVSQ
ncbi:hypothetical protein GCK72_013393 [Caenorhabditis remanei]|uniref:CCHC-type domain-containing protein n=1 Tax=Caenorhabditis remanei TaxID=31234 RepID=A0A6A5GNG3_CAERE|nr:hypothetical protein GCK72_013393 [Caenorhabditis remanei]KAF1756938.1 hypothetical protein GCK72_013393 [Caenorhabditis remanei]